MLIEGLNPVLWSVGPLQFRLYGVLMALSVLLGGWMFFRSGQRRGLDEDFLQAQMFAAVLGGLIGARLLYVLTNLSDYLAVPLEIVRIDHGGLSFHGALAGGILGAWLVARRHRLSLLLSMDFAVPGLALGYALVRIANIFNQEILGRPAALLGLDRHPTQIYGALIGLFLLVAHHHLSRSPRKPGELFWLFFLNYSLLRGLIEETFRDNPLYLVGYTSEAWGIGLFTLTHILTPALVLISAVMISRIRAGSGQEPAR